MKRFLHSLCLVLALTAALVMLPAPRALAAKGTPAAADYITVAADGTVTLHSTHMAAEEISSVQLTLDGAADFTISAGLTGRLAHVRAGNGSVTVYIAGAEALMSGETLVLGTVTPAEGMDSVKLAKQSLKYVYGSSAVAQNFEDGQEPGGGEKTPEEARADLQAAVDGADALAAEQSNYTSDSWKAFQAALGRAKDVLARTGVDAEEMAAALADLAAARAALVPVAVQGPEVERGGSGGTIYDGYDDGTGSGAPEPTGTPEPTPEPSAEPTASAAPSETPAPTGAPVTTSEPMTTDAPAAKTAPTQAPAVQAGNTGPQAPATGDETVFLPWALTLCICAALLAAVILRAKRRQ